MPAHLLLLASRQRLAGHIQAKQADQDRSGSIDASQLWRRDRGPSHAQPKSAVRRPAKAAADVIFAIPERCSPRPANLVAAPAADIDARSSPLPSTACGRHCQSTVKPGSGSWPYARANDQCRRAWPSQFDPELPVKPSKCWRQRRRRRCFEGTFSIADIAMADVLRLDSDPNGLNEPPSCRDCVARATARPAFTQAHAGQLAHFANAD